MKSSSLSPLVAVIGPTGCGKSDLALRLAREVPAEIVNCDSLQLYRYFDIGTAKLSEAEREGVPHHLLDILDPGQETSAGDYARRAREVIAEITARGRLAVVTGGTGFYLRALLDGLAEAPARDDAIRRRLAGREQRRPGSLHRILRRLDPSSARRVHAHDLNKLVRALEVCLRARGPMSALFAAGRDPLQGYRTWKVGLNPPRAALYAQIDERCRRMFQRGLVEEVRRILDLGYSPESKPFQSHGYRQVIGMLRGEIDPQAALEEAQRNTRRYAKRQWTWFLREAGIDWLDGFGGDPKVQDAAVAGLRKFLTSFTDFAAV
ncbi:MAG: tRNA (adenosine(37)-N6)-dimethylallyltransferase MiaA [Bryobacteraceae bacterium]